MSFVLVKEISLGALGKLELFFGEVCYSLFQSNIIKFSPIFMAFPKILIPLDPSIFRGPMTTLGDPMIMRGAHTLTLITTGEGFYLNYRNKDK